MTRQEKVDACAEWLESHRVEIYSNGLGMERTRCMYNESAGDEISVGKALFVRACEKIDFWPSHFKQAYQEVALSSDRWWRAIGAMRDNADSWSGKPAAWVARKLRNFNVRIAPSAVREAAKSARLDIAA